MSSSYKSHWTPMFSKMFHFIIIFHYSNPYIPHFTMTLASPTETRHADLTRFFVVAPLWSVRGSRVRSRARSRKTAPVGLTRPLGKHKGNFGGTLYTHIYNIVIYIYIYIYDIICVIILHYITLCYIRFI